VSVRNHKQVDIQKFGLRHPCETSSGLQYRQSRHVPRARDSNGGRNPRGLGWVITLTAMTTEVSNRLTNAKSRTLSASHFLMSAYLGFWLLETIISIEAPDLIKHQTPWHLRFCFGKWWQGHSKKFIGRFLPFLPIVSLLYFSSFFPFLIPFASSSYGIWAL